MTSAVSLCLAARSVSATPRLLARAPGLSSPPCTTICRPLPASSPRYRIIDGGCNTRGRTAANSYGERDGSMMSEPQVILTWAVGMAAILTAVVFITWNLATALVQVDATFNLVLENVQVSKGLVHSMDAHFDNMDARLDNIEALLLKDRS